ncbi:efflux RND transporter permease subunit [Methylocystis parvus]|uniref:efflux RND transporter permease subunit n=1 Tax=Methylocystis parvus TaxID=134 RepID=UPI003C759E49
MMSKFFIERPVLANVIAILLVVLGAVALFALPISQYPNIVPPTVQVTARYPGASPQTVIDTVALPIELQVNGVDGMLYMQSTSASDGTYSLTVTFKIGMNPDTAQVLVQNRVSNALASLPAAVQAQGVTVNKKSTAILQIVTLTSPQGTHDALYLSNYATINLVNELARLPGVGNVNVFGSGKYAMRIWMDPEKLHSFGLQPSDVVKAIQQQSQIVAAGQTGMPPAPASQDFQYTIDIQSRLDDPGEFANIIVKAQTAQGGRLVRVKDIGRIELGSQNYSQQTFVDGKPAALIAIYQTPDANSLQVGKEVGAKMDELAKRFPSDLVYDIPYNTTIFVKASIDEVYHTLYEAGFLVLVVILFFLQNFRATLVPATTVPITIIGAFAAMYGLGYTVNLSTLFGIVLAIGIVVDDAIVITEAVSADIEKGMSSHDAAIKAMSELMGPIIGITLVLMAVFLPAAFLPGLTGRMLAQFAVVIAATALISALNAATLKPTQCALWLRPAVPPEERNAVYRTFNAIYDPLERAYTRLVTRLVARSKTVVLVGLAISIIGLVGVARLPTAFIPNEDQGYAMTAVQLPEGAALGRTINALQEAGKIALATPGVKHVITIAGISVLDNSATLANAGVNYVMFDAWEEREKHKGEDLVSLVMGLQKKMEQLPERAFMLVPPPIQGIGNAGGFQMQLELLGGSFSYPRLAEGANGVVGAAKESPVVQRVLTTFRESAPHVEMTVDRVQAETLRVSVGDVFSTLTSYVGSSYVNQFVKYGLPLQVYVQADSRYRLQPDDLLGMYVRSQDGNMVPLGTLARLSETSAPPLITLYNLYPSATIVGSPMSGYSSGQAMTEMEALARKLLPKDIAFEWSAISYQEKITGDLLYWGFALSVLLVYLVLAGQYESWILPLAVIAAVPLALIGPMLTLTALGVDNNLYVQIGLMLLIALSAKNGILIVEVAREHRIFGGKPIMEAAIDAARIRFRPILMTSFAFILGVVPLAIATGAGANARRSLGISVLTGMLSSTLLAVVLVPAFFVVLQQIDEARKGRKEPANEPPAPVEPSLVD